jgi:hypothetical protein
MSHQEGECRIWDGPLNNIGYGVFSYTDARGKRRSMGAHKAAFLAWGGTLYPGEVVRHTPCWRYRCIEPKHLAASTQKRNLDDRKYNGTYLQRGGDGITAAERQERLRAIQDGITGPEFAKRFAITLNGAYQWMRRWKQRAVNPGNN